MLFDYGLDGLEYDVNNDDVNNDYDNNDDVNNDYDNNDYDNNDDINNDDVNNDIALNSGSIGETIKRIKAVETQKLSEVAGSNSKSPLFSVFGHWATSLSEISPLGNTGADKIDYMLGLDDKSFAFELAKIKNSVTELQEVSGDSEMPKAFNYNPPTPMQPTRTTTHATHVKVPKVHPAPGEVPEGQHPVPKVPGSGNTVPGMTSAGDEEKAPKLETGGKVTYDYRTKDGKLPVLRGTEFIAENGRKIRVVTATPDENKGSDYRSSSWRAFGMDDDGKVSRFGMTFTGQDNGEVKVDFYLPDSSPYDPIFAPPSNNNSQQDVDLPTEILDFMKYPGGAWLYKQGERLFEDPTKLADFIKESVGWARTGEYLTDKLSKARGDDGKTKSAGTEKPKLFNFNKPSQNQEPEKPWYTKWYNFW